jgi:Fe-S-cluster containining protein
MVTLRPHPGPDQICPFVTMEGCRVYPNRPSSCRIYPLARAISQNRKTGRIREHFALIEEPHCRGREDGQTRTVDQWIVSQQLEEYNQANDRMMALISHKNKHHPGPLSLADARMFYLACYDFDTFRENILKNRWLDEQELDPDIRTQIAKDDSFLLQFGMDWIQQKIMAE